MVARIRLSCFRCKNNPFYWVMANTLKSRWWQENGTQLRKGEVSVSFLLSQGKIYSFNFYVANWLYMRAEKLLFAWRCWVLFWGYTVIKFIGWRKSGELKKNQSNVSEGDDVVVLSQFQVGHVVHV
ncbi:hypothetical protein VNO80_08573 [Phaseolus coccineus]|uniref:Uncharacterized protein n=1 Tax=Phaseolus coccineus TaxID=3886 RepID=A0AAN9N4R2_PHACN